METTISRGRLAFHKGEVLVERGTGRFVELPPWAPIVFDGQREREAHWIQVFPDVLSGHPLACSAHLQAQLSL